jgi:antimicrobial peptide system SdpB family protein
LSDHLELARWIAIACLVLVVIGWRPRLTCLLHWWVTTSLMLTCILADGGDQLASVLTLLLVPILLLDSRRWHWETSQASDHPAEFVRTRLARWSLRLIRLQVAVVYLHAATGKFAGREWRNGTAIYYWLLDTRIGVPEAYHVWVLRLLDQPFMTVLLTWGPIILELALFTALVMPSTAPARRWLFVFGVLFHAGNVVFFGLVSFFFSTLSAVTLLCLPADLRPSLARLPGFFRIKAWTRRADVGLTLERG